MALIKEIGTIMFKSEVTSGISTNGYSWQRQTVVVEFPDYQGTFRKVALQANKERVEDLKGLAVGEKVEVTYKVSAREWDGKWYNSVDIIRIGTPKASTPQINEAEVQPNPDDLPF